MQMALGQILESEKWKHSSYQIYNPVSHKQLLKDGEW